MEARRRAWSITLLTITVSLTSTLADDVITLTADNFDETVTSHRVALVEFYAPWCGHCQRLAPEYERAAAALVSEGVALGKVDATEQEELAERYAVQGYPTLKVFHSGVPYDYDGPRNAAGIIEYMRAVASPSWEPPRDVVLVLTQHNFTHAVSSSKPVLVEFYAPWCGHCKKLAPEYQRAATKLSQMNIPASLAKVDATVETQLASQYEVKGYPTLKLFRNGNHKDYTGRRDTQAIVEFMMEQTLPGSQQVTTRKELSKLRKEAIDPLIVTFGSNEETPVIKAHLAGADEGRGHAVQFAHCLSLEVAASYGLADGDTAIFMPKWFRSEFDPEMKIYHIDPEDWEKEEGEVRSKVLENLLAAARPLVGLRVRRNEAWFDSQPLLILYCDVEEMEYVRGQVASIASDYSTRLTVALSNNEDYQRELDDLGLGDWGEDVSVGLWGEGRERYAMTTPTSQDNIREFVESYFAGELEEVIRSQPLPRKPKDGAVTVVVGSSFQNLVLDPSRDVLVEFYAPWCGHCKALEPVYQRLAKKYKKDESLLIAKFDATANDSPANFQFSGFPAIFFVPAGSDVQPVLYSEQSRELDDLVAFIDTHRTAGGRNSQREEL